MRTFFVFIYRYFEKHPKLYWACLLLIFGWSALTASRIHFEQDINKMIPHDPAIEAMNNVLNQTQAGSEIIFTLSFKDHNRIDPDRLIVLQDSLQSRLEQVAGDDIKNIKSRVADEKEQQLLDLTFQYLPLFLTEKDYQQIDRFIQPEHIKNALQKDRKLLLSPAGMVAGQWIAKDPLGLSGLAFQKLKSLNINPGYELYNGYIFNNDNRELNFFLTPKYPASETGKNQILFHKVDDLLVQWAKTHPGLNITYFGGAAVAAGNAAQMQQDTILTLSITIILLLVLIWYVFRRKRAPFLLMIPVIFGGTFGLAVMALIQGSVSIIAVGAGAIILGIAIDFSVHFMSHARSHPDMEDNVKTLVFPLTLGAFTTIGAFYVLRFAHAPVLRDLGLYAAASLLGASLFTLIFLPHLLSRFSRKKEKPVPPNFIDKLARLRPEGNKYLLVFVVLATPVLWYFAGHVQFDSDLMHLNYLSPKLKKAQEQLDKHNAFALSAVFVVADGKTEEAAAQRLSRTEGLMQQLKQEGKIRQSLNPLMVLPSRATQEQRLQRWNHFWSDEKKESVLELVEKEAQNAGFNAHAFGEFSETLNRKYQPFDTETAAFLKTLMPGAYSDRNGKHLLVAALKIEPGQRAAVLNAFSGQNQVIITDRQSVSEALLATLNQDFNRLFYISGALVFLALLLAYGRIELALISFLPMAITWIWILGLMALLGLEFNIVNIIIATLIFGLGDDYSIFMMDGLLEQYRTGKNKITASRSAVYLSVLTTIIGLGTLIFAQHPALRSVAFISILGLLCVVFIAQVIQPFLFNFLIQKRTDKGFMPFTLWSLLKSAFSFFYFFLGCFLLTLAGVFLIGLKPFGKKRSKYLFHFLLSKYTGSVMYIMANVKKRIINQSPHVFERPAIYIANHSSFLDILMMSMIHPKLVLLTNKWVWHSPVFGRIVRMAEYYPVADGANESVAPLRDLVKRGYGIVIFPEGTRSADDTIHRFHKGAFFLAEKLNLNIVPVLLHGVHYTMQKGDWLLKDGTVTLKILPPIAPEDPSFGKNYSERAKLTARWFRARFQEEKKKRETPKYFREQLIKSTLYKGPVLEWYAKIKIRLEGYYELFHALLPEQGFFYDLGCGYGFMTYMLHWSAPERKFIGYDYDEEKIITAAHNYTQNKFPKKDTQNIFFQQADITQVQLKPCDGIIISDALHYLLPLQQTALLEKCYAALPENGILIIREGASDLAKRHRGTRWTERFSTRIFKFNKTQNQLHFLDRPFFEHWADQHAMSLELIDDTQKTSNLIFVFKKDGSGS